MQLTVAEVHEAVGGSLLASPEEAKRKQVTGVTWDSRTVGADNVFLALPGERVDGNDFIIQAVGAGAGLVICTREPSPQQRAMAGEFACPLIVVPDGVEALGKLAHYWRERLHVLVVGVTGSTGKTSTKDLLYAVLSQRYRTVATTANHNNELGVPATILAAGTDCEVLVVEMGMRGLGQIAQLCEIVCPNIGVVTNVGTCHMELLGSRENIARAKGELLASLPPTGLAVVNADDDMTDVMLESADVAKHGVLAVRFGFSKQSDTHIENLTMGEDACASFTLQISGRPSFDVHLAVPGYHSVLNAVSAACVASYLGVSPEKIALGLAAAHISGMRMEATVTADGVRLVNDAYNANPDSMRASLETLALMTCENRRIAVLGDMGELGEGERDLHAGVGAVAARCNLGLLVCVGELARCMADGAVEAGMQQQRVVCVDDVAQAVSLLRSTVEPGDVVLVKASRFMGMERIVEELSS